MVSINTVLLGGNLTRSPESKTIGTAAHCSFGLAMNERWKSGEETKERVTFVEIECWGKTAELCAQYLTKGSPVMVEGKLQLDQWENQDGQQRSRLFVRAATVQFLQGRRQ